VRCKVLAEDAFRVVAALDGAVCPTEAFLLHGESTTAAQRLGLYSMLERVAELGLSEVPSSWFHEANKEHGIYEFIKGPLRLFFFKGRNGDIAVCTTGVLKKGQKVDKSAVQRAVGYKKAYEAALTNKTYQVINDEDQ